MASVRASTHAGEQRREIALRSAGQKFPRRRRIGALGVLQQAHHRRRVVRRVQADKHKSQPRAQKRIVGGLSSQRFERRPCDGTARGVDAMAIEEGQRRYRAARGGGERDGLVVRVQQSRFGDALNTLERVCSGRGQVRAGSNRCLRAPSPRRRERQRDREGQERRAHALRFRASPVQFNSAFCARAVNFM